MAIKTIIDNIKKESQNITLVAATKTRSIKEIQEAISAGIEIIGENYVREAEEKYRELKGKVKFHCIGHLQTNKVKKAVEIFDMIQAVDTITLAKKIDKRCKTINKTMPILIEVNIGEEPNKNGCMPNEVEQLAKEITQLRNLRLHGLMTMAPFFGNNEQVRPYFKKMKQLYDKLKQKYSLKILSMGMSHSYKTAIEEGANMVRLGSVIFGERS